MISCQESERLGGRRAALAVAHPGHELRLLEWMREARPTLYVMTAGSRHGDGRDRIEASRALAAALGSAQGEVFGQGLDRDVYARIMAGDAALFLDLSETLAESFVRRRIELVVVDGWQMYDVNHDLWHLTVRAATAVAARRLGRAIECLDFEVVPPTMGARPIGPVRAARVLSDSQVEAKLAVAAAFPDLAQDVREVLAAGGREFIAAESLHALRPLSQLRPRDRERPRYESHGEARVAAGIYAAVLRWRHAAPIADALEAVLDARIAA